MNTETISSAGPVEREIRPVAYVQRMGSFQGVPHYGCLLTIEAEQRMKVNDALYGQAELDAAKMAAVHSVQKQLQSSALRDVATERRRQIEAEGWTPEHDDTHDRGELAAAAAAYAHAAEQSMHPLNKSTGSGYETKPPTIWPDCWDDDHWKHADPRKMLVKAGALILAEIERLDRMLPNATNEPPEGSGSI